MGSGASDSATSRLGTDHAFSITEALKHRVIQGSCMPSAPLP